MKKGTKVFLIMLTVLIAFWGGVWYYFKSGLNKASGGDSQSSGNNLVSGGSSSGNGFGGWDNSAGWSPTFGGEFVPPTNPNINTQLPSVDTPVSQTSGYLSPVVRGGKGGGA